MCLTESVKHSIPRVCGGDSQTELDTDGESEYIRKSIEIRYYTPQDESEWLRCRVLSFMFSSYATDVQTTKQTYPHPAIELVAVENGQVVGLIDVELDSEDLTYCQQAGAMVWNLAVLPEYQHQGIAQALWTAAKHQLVTQGVHYCELWTQDDVAANQFYRGQGFQLRNEMTYLRCFLRPGMQDLTIGDTVQHCFVEVHEIQVPFDQKATMQRYCSKITEVRMYAQTF